MHSIMKKFYHFFIGIFYFVRCTLLGIKYKKGVRIRRGVKIERGTKLVLSKYCWVGANVEFWGGGKIILGENTHIGSHSSIYSCKEGGVTFGSNVNCARNLFVIDTNHQYSNKSKLICKQGLVSEPIFIGDDVWIGVNCTILKGAQIGSGCVVGACTMVNKKFGDNLVIVGIPAKAIKQR